jgi:hypothetical protein
MIYQDKMWCLAVSIARPDYKRPSFYTNIYFLKTEQEALCKLKESKILFIADFDISEDTRIETLTTDSPDELVSEFFEEISHIDNFYSNSYMNAQPFGWNITEIKVGESIKL